MVTPPNVRDKMVKDIQNLKRQAMLNDGNAAGLLRSGDASGLEQLFNQGQYEQCLNLAEK